MFPFGMPLVLVVFLVVIFYVVFGRNAFRRPRGPETAIEILRERYAKGELTREAFEQMKRDLGA